MRLDVEIYIKAKSPTIHLTRELLISVSSIEPTEIKDIYRLMSFDRYYGIGYERGDAVRIIGTLALLLNSPEVEKVWYDCTGFDLDEHPETADSLCELLKYFIKNGEISYRESEPNIPLNLIQPPKAI